MPTPTVTWPTPGGEGEAQELAFGTVSRGGSPGTGEYWTTPAPAMVVITTPEENDRLGAFVDTEAREQLLALDYNTRFAVAVFLGWFPGDRGQRVEVEQVARRGGQVALYARAPESGPDTLDTEISPYHVISIAQEGEWNREIEFTLYLNGEVVVTEAHFIP